MSPEDKDHEDSSDDELFAELEKDIDDDFSELEVEFEHPAQHIFGRPAGPAKASVKVEEQL